MLPELIAADAMAVVHFVEGEKDADNLAKLGLVATTVSEGAGKKWDPALTPWFKDRPVVILPDADVPGRKHAVNVARVLHGVAASVKLVDLFPDRTDGSDVSDWLLNDPDATQLRKLVTDAPLWQLAAAAATPATAPAANADDARIKDLAQLNAFAYARRRREEAKKLGITTGVLDRLVKAETSAKFCHTRSCRYS